MEDLRNFVQGEDPSWVEGDGDTEFSEFLAYQLRQGIRVLIHLAQLT